MNGFTSTLLDHGTVGRKGLLEGLGLGIGLGLGLGYTPARITGFFEARPTVTSS